MEQSSPSSSLPLQTVSNGTPPSKRVANASDARMICESLIYASRNRALFNSKIKGMMDGNAPYDPVKLRQQAQAYRTNINFLEGKASLSAALVPYYDLFAGAQFYCEVNLGLDNPDDNQKKSDIVTEEFDALLKDYTAFEFNMHAILHDFIAFGRGFVLWPNKWGWHFQRISFSRVYVPDSTDASIDNLEVLVIRDKKQVHKLWADIRNKKSAEAMGWNTKAAALAIEEAVPEERTTNQTDALSYEYLQQRMKDRDLVEGLAKQATVQLNHLFVKEFDGTVTHMILRERQTTSKERDGYSEEFICEKQHKYDHFREAISAFFLETLDGSWNGARGLGHDIYAPIEIKNRLLCKITDNAFLSGGITLQAMDENAKTKTSLVQAGDFNIIPPGYDVKNASIFANNTGLINAGQLLDQVLTGNTGIYRAKMEQPKGNPRTAKEVEIQMQNATVLSNSGVSRFYNQLDVFYSELYRRVSRGELLADDKSEETEAVRDLRERCKKRGVTLDELKNVRWVRAYRNIGNGSQFQRRQLLESFEPFVQFFRESGRDKWFKDLLSAQFGATAANRYDPDDSKDTPDDQMAWAMMENAIMKDGAPAAWTPTQNNLTHATQHLKAMSGAIESLQQGADPMKVLGFMEIAGPHANVHLEKLKTDQSKKKEYADLSKAMKRLSGFTDELHAHVQEQQQQAAQQQQEQAQAAEQAKQIGAGTDPDSQIKIAKAQQDMSLKDLKTKHKLALDTAKAKQKLAISDVVTASKIKNEHAREQGKTK